MRLSLILAFISCLMLLFTTMAMAQTEMACQDFSAKEKIQAAPVIFKGTKKASDFEIITVYKGLIQKGVDVLIKESASILAGQEYIIFAEKNTDGELVLDHCGISFEKSSISEKSHNAEILAELEIFKAQVNALAEMEESFPKGKGGMRSWVLEMGSLLQEYGDYERALDVYKQEIMSRYNFKYNKKTKLIEKIEPPRDLFAEYQNNRGGMPGRYDGFREELKEYGIVLTKLGRYEEALVPLEMAVASGMGADAQQLYFESILRSKGKEYFNGKEIRLEQIGDQPSYEINGVDLSDIKIAFAYTANTTFNDVNFSGSDLSDSRFSSTVVFKSTNFINSKLENIKFEQTKYDKNTIWPEGFKPAEHGLMPYSEEAKEK